jgi:arylsulfatase A-like enzyme
MFFAVAGVVCHGAERPNIILMMADDLGYGDTGFNGNKIIKTPHLDEMAKAGVKLTHFYAGGPVCSPTRGTCLTGVYQSRKSPWPECSKSRATRPVILASGISGR